ncbi:uncharacterized protein [Phyllobates terribilis]|uniref:uncharacterized protein n=1 Tax=Phyllobates terribilis TaxID=111132 RepID=UPI003CCB3A82
MVGVVVWGVPIPLVLSRSLVYKAVTSRRRSFSSYSRNSRGVCEIQNTHITFLFSSSQTKENVTSTDLHCPFKGIEESKLSVNRKIVREYLAKINEFKSPGPDELHPRVLKEIIEEILEPLSIIFENSWRTGEVPEDWRRANVVPIFKKGKKVDPGNYRPESTQAESAPPEPRILSNIEDEATTILKNCKIVCTDVAERGALAFCPPDFVPLSCSCGMACGSWDIRNQNTCHCQCSNIDWTSARCCKITYS